MSSKRPAAGAHAGFTLLEVMAAVAVLAIAYAALGASGIQGLQIEGESRRRIEASLLADAVLGEIEAFIEQGVSPPLGQEEREQGDYQIVVEVTPFALTLPELDDAGGNRIGRARSRLGGDAAQAPPPPGPSLLEAGRGPGAVPPLRRIDVQVAWIEGWGERAVARTSFALDQEAAAEALAALTASAAGQAPDATNPLGGDAGIPPEGAP